MAAAKTRIAAENEAEVAESSSSSELVVVTSEYNCTSFNFPAKAKGENFKITSESRHHGVVVRDGVVHGNLRPAGAEGNVIGRITGPEFFKNVKMSDLFGGKSQKSIYYYIPCGQVGEAARGVKSRVAMILEKKISSEALSIAYFSTFLEPVDGEVCPRPDDLVRPLLLLLGELAGQALPPLHHELAVGVGDALKVKDVARHNLLHKRGYKK